MSIITKRGDDGYTDLLFGQRISKTSHRIAALGAIDELNAALGLVRAADTSAVHHLTIDRLQNLLFGLMGEIACLPEHVPQYLEKGYARLQEADLEWITNTAKAEEAKGVRFTGWAVPGAEGSLARAHLDYARTVSRRAERAVLILHETGEEVPLRTRLFLNRLSDLMWILARVES